MNVVDVLVARDGMSAEEVRKILDGLRYEMFSMIENGGGEMVEEFLMDNVGLEPDYIFEILNGDY